jgi:hypothetical protein
MFYAAHIFAEATWSVFTVECLLKVADRKCRSTILIKIPSRSGFCFFRKFIPLRT